MGVGAVVLKVHRTCQTCDISLKRRVADREERDGGLEVTQDDLCSPSDTIRLLPEPSDAPLSSFITLWRSLTRAASFTLSVGVSSLTCSGFLKKDNLRQTLYLVISGTVCNPQQLVFK